MAQVEKRPRTRTLERQNSRIHRSLRHSISALPQEVVIEQEGEEAEAFETFEDCLNEAIRKRSLTAKDPFGKWLAERRAKSKGSKKREEAKRALQSACFHYYDARSPCGNVESSFIG